MALQFHPNAGAILICEYSGFKAPEMVKRRPVIVVSPRLRKRSNLCTIVPLSTLAPDDVMPWHIQIELKRTLPAPFSSPLMWVKCDMVTTVAFHRLDLMKAGPRQYIKPEVSIEDLQLVRSGIWQAIGGSV